MREWTNVDSGLQHRARDDRLGRETRSLAGACACRVAANFPVEAYVCSDLELASGSDELQQRRRPSAATDAGLLLLVRCEHLVAQDRAVGTPGL